MLCIKWLILAIDYTLTVLEYLLHQLLMRNGILTIIMTRILNSVIHQTLENFTYLILFGQAATVGRARIKYARLQLTHSEIRVNTPLANQYTNLSDLTIRAMLSLYFTLMI